MIDRLEILVSRVRYALSRTRWSAWLLGHTVEEGHENEPGLILVQIDGLSEPALREALRAGRMPFLARLVEQEGTEIRSLYTGLPSLTPGFQGEFFYGVPTAVPSFRFRDPELRRTVVMNDPVAAAQLEVRLRQGRSELLRGGSAWSSVFTGGAAESHLCAATLGPRETLRALAPRRVVLYLLWHGWSFVRAAMNAAAVSALALRDVGKRRMAGSDLLATLRFLPLRVGASVLIREIVATGASVDAERGLPVVHVNFLGYDEHAHRRGPDSRFAIWSLRGIDNAIRRVWLAAHRSRRRDYQVWIYSDHGLEVAEPWRGPAGPDPAAAVRSALDRLAPGAPAEVVTLGPISHVYLDGDPTLAAPLAEALVRDYDVPTAIRALDDGGAEAFSAGERLRLPDDVDRLFPEPHPHRASVAEDLVRLARHPGAGTLLLLGWNRTGPRTFREERGAHGGPGPNETSGFLLLPPEAEAFAPHAGSLRPIQLRRMVCRALERDDDSRIELRSGRAEPRDDGDGETAVRLRLMTYNVHGCRGMDGTFSPGRIARVIARERPDVVCLQELDQERSRSGRIDQIGVIARRLRADYQFHAVSEIDDGRFGNAVLSSLPLRLVGAGPLPSATRAKSMFNLWDRGVLWVALELGGGEIHVVNTHLSILQHERRLQAEAILGPEWLGRADGLPVVLAGDMNAAPGSWTLGRLETRLRNAVNGKGNEPALRTWTGRIPVRRIDHVLVSESVAVERVYVPRTRLSRVASDHLPLVVDLVCRCRDGAALAGVASAGGGD